MRSKSIQKISPDVSRDLAKLVANDVILAVSSEK